MAKRKRRKHSGAFKAKAALAALAGNKTSHAKIGQLTFENGFLEGALTKAGLLSAKK